MTSIIFDNGSYETKAGFSGDQIPGAIFPSIISGGKNEVFVGEDAWRQRNTLAVRRTIHGGTTQNWDDLHHIWLHTYNNELRVDSEYYPLLICEATSIPRKDREMNIYKAFESFQVPAYYSSFSSELMMYASGKTTGIAVSLGYDGSIICPVYDGKAIRSSMITTYVGGRQITEKLMTSLNCRGYDVNDVIHVVNDMKEKVCYIASHYDDEVIKAKERLQTIEQSYELPDGQIIQTDVERFTAPEVLFKPHLMGMSEVSLHQAIYTSSLRCDDKDIRRSLLDSVILGGGCSLLPQLPERLQRELSTLFPPTIKPNLVVPAERKYSVWLGGSILSSLSTFREQWITKGEYEEHGPDIVHQRCS